MTNGLEGAALYGIADGDGVVIAVGAADGAAAAWITSDGVTWRRARVAGATRAARLRGVAAGPDGYLAFGGGDGEVSQVWTSGDGTRWDRQAATDGIGARVNAVTFSDGRWLAVGDLLAAEGGEAAAGVLYTSGDGRSWRLETDELTGTEATVSDVAVRGGVVVVGGFGLDGGLMWADVTDGAVRADGDFAATTVQGVAATKDGFVALGRHVADVGPVAWRSNDGAGWQRLDVDPQPFATTDQIHDLTAVDGRLVAVGATPDGGVIWTSADGGTWTRER